MAKTINDHCDDDQQDHFGHDCLNQKTTPNRFIMLTHTLTVVNLATIFNDFTRIRLSYTIVTLPSRTQYFLCAPKKFHIANWNKDTRNDLKVEFHRNDKLDHC